VANGKGIQYSTISREVENNFKKWLDYSGLKENECFSMISNGSSAIHLEEDSEYTHVYIMSESKSIGEPFIWQKNSKVPYKAFWLDLMLFLSYMASQSECERFLKTVKEFSEKYKVNLK